VGALTEHLTKEDLVELPHIMAGMGSAVWGFPVAPIPPAASVYLGWRDFPVSSLVLPPTPHLSPTVWQRRKRGVYCARLRVTVLCCTALPSWMRPRN